MTNIRKSMKQRKKHRGVQGYALLYGRSSRAIRIINGETEKGVIIQRAPRKNNGETGKKVKPQRAPKKNGSMNKTTPKKYVMDEKTKQKLDVLQDPLAIMSRFTRAQKYEASNTTEKYEYGLSDW